MRTHPDLVCRYSHIHTRRILVCSHISVHISICLTCTHLCLQKKQKPLGCLNFKILLWINCHVIMRLLLSSIESEGIFYFTFLENSTVNLLNSIALVVSGKRYLYRCCHLCWAGNRKRTSTAQLCHLTSNTGADTLRCAWNTWGRQGRSLQVAKKVTNSFSRSKWSFCLAHDVCWLKQQWDSNPRTERFDELSCQDLSPDQKLPNPLSQDQYTPTV